MIIVMHDNMIKQCILIVYFNLANYKFEYLIMSTLL